MYRMAEPQRKKIKLTLKKKNKEEAHAWANAYEAKVAETYRGKPVHVTKALVNRELTGKLPQKGVETGIYRQRIKPQKKQLKDLEAKLKREPGKKLSWYRDDKYKSLHHALWERKRREKPNGTPSQRMDRIRSFGDPKLYPNSLQPFMPKLKEEMETLHDKIYRQTVKRPYDAKKK